MIRHFFHNKLKCKCTESCNHQSVWYSYGNILLSFYYDYTHRGRYSTNGQFKQYQNCRPQIMSLFLLRPQ